ncbi:TPA: fimbrial protein [Stenotrophomonas maltophilia]
MKTTYLLIAVLLLGAPALAHADSATITVTGTVLPGTCTMADVAVALDPIDALDLNKQPVSGTKPATLNFSACFGVSSIDLSFDGADDSSQDGQWKNGAGSGAASGIAVALLDGPTGPDFLKRGATKVVMVNGAATAKLEMGTAYYHRPGTPFTAGAVSTQITVTAVYK